MSQVDNLDIDAILDGNIDELLDRKVFTPLPIGTYLMRFGWERATMEEHDFVGVIFNLSLIRPLEFANPQDAQLFEEGGVFHGDEEITRNVRCYFTDKDGAGSHYGQGTVKEVAQGFIDAGLVEPNEDGKFPIAQVLDSVTGFEVITKVRHNKDRQDKTRIYENFESIVPNTEYGEE